MWIKNIQMGIQKWQKCKAGKEIQKKNPRGEKNEKNDDNVIKISEISK